jgi:putative mRNA 3-end processing factor
MQLSCNGTTIALDSSKGDVTFLSHAHSDHASGLKRVKKIISSPATLELANLKAEPVEVKGAKMLDAGHIFGSRQLLVEEDGKKTVYTGDISLKENIFGSKAEIPQCDRLIIEATYGGMPEYHFPSNHNVYSEIEKWVKSNDGSNLLIGAYEMGKAQELIKVLNDYCGLAPVVTEKTERNCIIFEKNGIHLDRVVVGSDEAEEAMSHRFVGIVPMRLAKRYFANRLSDAFGRTTLCAVATGWAMTHRFSADNSFPLSDHADFHDLKNYIESSGAKEVEFFCGDGSLLKDSLSGNGIFFKD